MAEALAEFRAHMDGVARIAVSMPVPSKVRRYVRAYEAGLPLDITVRWFPQDALHLIEARVAELVGQDLEVWISQGSPWLPDADNQLSSIERKTDLLKGITSLEDLRGRVFSSLANWQPGSWAKVFYDTPQRSLIGGTIRVDTNRMDGFQGVDMRAIRFEAASGISDVRDLDRQVSARKVIVVHSDHEVIGRVRSALEADYEVIGSSLDDVSKDSGLIDFVVRFGGDNRGRVQEPKAIVLDFDTSPETSLRLIKSLKSNKNTSFIPIIPLLKDETSLASDLRSMVASYAYLPISPENVQQSVYLTGIRLTGGPRGFQFHTASTRYQREVVDLVSTVFGLGGAHRRMMAQIANAEQRPTIAFEFKLVPVAPYDFFFLDYEWSGLRSPLHRFDWLLTFGDC